MNLKYFFILISALLLLFLGILFKRWQLLLSLVPILLLLADRNEFSKVEVERTPIPKRMMEGNEVTVEVNIRARANPPFMLEVSDTIPKDATIVEGKRKMVFSLRNGEEGRLSYTVRLSRGHCTFGPLTIRASNVSGTRTKIDVVEKKVSIIVLPRFEEIRIPLFPKRHRSTAGIFPSRFVGRGYEFFSVRNYSWGDEQRVINWKATARTGKLKSNDYENERAVDALLVVDAREETSQEKLLLDGSLSAALSCAHFLLGEKNRVGLLVFSDIQYHIPFDYGRKQFLKMADALSGVTSRGRHPFRYVVGFLNRLPQSCMVILISPLLDPDMEEQVRKLSLSTQRLIILSPSSIEVESRMLGETRETVLARRLLTLEKKALLKRLSSHARVVEWDAVSSLRAVMEDFI